MHYFLADSQAKQLDPEARALLLDAEGHVLEASTANLLIVVRGEGIVSPPTDRILPGISIGVIEELATERGIPFCRRDITVDDVYHADEAMLCSTSPCVWPVSHLNGRAIGTSVPGPVTRQLLAAWSDLVGLDIEQQAQRFSAGYTASGQN